LAILTLSVSGRQHADHFTKETHKDVSINFSSTPLLPFFLDFFVPLVAESCHSVSFKILYTARAVYDDEPF